MVLVVADALNVIPRIGLMTAIALVDLNVSATRVAWAIRFAGNCLVNHFKVHHVVARRRLMALRAIRRTRRRVNEAGDCPLRRAVTLRAVLPEQLEVRVFVRVATRAVQSHLRRRDLRVRGACAFGCVVLSNPRHELIARLPLLAVRLIRAEFAQSEPR